MTRSAAVITTALAAAVAVPLAASAATSGDVRSRTIDRTVSCTVRGVGSPDTVRVLDVWGEPRFGKSAPSVNATTGGEFVSPTGEPPGNDWVGAGFRTGRTLDWDSGLTWLNSSSCNATRTRPALAATGLRGGRVPSHESHQCDVPARVLIRLRAVLRKPVDFEPTRRPYYLTAAGRMLRGALVVTTAAGKPIVYASVDDETGRTEIFTAASRCFPT
jgi:hypothetical protein